MRLGASLGFPPIHFFYISVSDYTTDALDLFRKDRERPGNSHVASICHNGEGNASFGRQDRYTVWVTWGSSINYSTQGCDISLNYNVRASVIIYIGLTDEFLHHYLTT